MGNFVQDVQNAIHLLLQTQGDTFVGIGLNLFRGFATILVVWYGIKTALSAASGGDGFDFSNFASLLMVISFGFAMINYYSNPLPGVGYSFHDLITRESSFLSNHLTGRSLETFTRTLGDLIESLVRPYSILDVPDYIQYFILLGALILCQAIALVVTAYGFIATAVCVIVGPIFIPFFIVPKMEWLFWGWFKAFLQYSFYQVVSAAFLLVLTNVFTTEIQFLIGNPAIPLTPVRQAAVFSYLLVLSIAGIFGLLQIPRLTAHIFSGTAGSSSAGLFGLAAAALRRAG